MAARGLGKGLDSLIPDAVGEAKAKKEVKETTGKKGWRSCPCQNHIGGTQQKTASKKF